MVIWKTSPRASLGPPLAFLPTGALSAPASRSAKLIADPSGLLLPPSAAPEQTAAGGGGGGGAERTWGCGDRLSLSSAPAALEGVVLLLQVVG